ncbi:MAG: hypothetical protein ACLFSQ_06120 [Candidatus Zixiibacteriota bacterium]
MKKLSILFGILILIGSMQAVKIGSEAEETHIQSPRTGIGVDTLESPEAALEIQSDDSGILIPRLSISERDAISLPPTGLMIYNTDCELFNYYDGTDWIPFPNVSIVDIGPITGNETVCEGATSIPYSVDPIADAIDYSWTLPDGASIASGAGTESIMVDFGSVSGRVCVEVKTDCSIVGDCKLVSVSDATVGGAVSGGDTIDIGDTTPIMTLTGHIGDVINWEKRHEDGAWTDILVTGTSYFETPTLAGTWDYRAIVQNAGCAEQASDYTTVEVISAGSDSVIINYTGSPTTWTAPIGVSSATVKCWGASGGGTVDYGLGAYLEVQVSVTGGMTYDVFVGGQGGCCTDGAAGGGDGSYFANGSTPLVIAAGGGGGRDSGYSGGDGSATTTPNTGTRSNSSYGWGTIATGGNGGGAGDGEWGSGGGGGWYSAGDNGSGSSGGAMRCRGSDEYRYVGGAGGGYNGGPGGDMASGWGVCGGGGGGSYYSGTLIEGTSGDNIGNGKIIISW